MATDFDVFAGTTVVDGELYVDAERVGADTAAAQMVSLVEQAPRTDTRIQNYAERYADELVAPSLAAAGSFYALSGDVNRLTSMLLVDVGTGIRIAAPTSVLATMIRAARQGILVKGGRPLERLSSVDTIVFDKTGTLTVGSPEIVAVNACGAAEPDAILALAAAAELRCSHPVARAVARAAAAHGLAIPERSDSHYRLGLGVEARVCGSLVHAGSERFLQRRGIELQRARALVDDAHARGLSSLLVARDGCLIGTVEYRDRIRAESAAVVRTLRNRRVRCIMLTGDNQRVAAAVARELGLDEVYSGVLPWQKAEIIRRLQAQNRSVAMVGDGMNDTAALAYADVGIALHGGADVARASADVVLIDGSLWNLVTAIDLSSQAVRLIHQNWRLTAAANALAFLMAIPAGAVSPIVTALLSNGSAIIAGINAARPLWT